LSSACNASRSAVTAASALLKAAIVAWASGDSPGAASCAFSGASRPGISLARTGAAASVSGGAIPGGRSVGRYTIAGSLQQLAGLALGFVCEVDHPLAVQRGKFGRRLTAR